MNTDYTTDRAARLKIWKRNRHQVGGPDAVKANDSTAKLYAFQNPRMDDKVYTFVMNGTEYFPMAMRTLQSFTGLVFRKAPIFDGSDLFPQAVSVDGQTAEELARACFIEYMITNDGGLFIDTPDTPAGATVAELERLNFYSYQTLYPAEAIREIRHQAINGRKRLVYIRLIDDEYHGRELELVDGIYQATIWTRVKGQWFSETITPQVGGKPLTDIPFIPLNDGSNTAAMDGLCALNVVHFSNKFELQHIISWVSTPFMYITGVAEDVELDLTTTSSIRLENENAKIGWVTHNGQGLSEIKDEISTIEQHGSMLGSRMLIQEKSVSEAEGTVARRQAGENSILAGAARHVGGGCLTKAFKLQAMMQGKDASAVRYSLNTDFVPTITDPAILTAALALVQNGKMPDEAFFELLQKMEIAHESWDYETWMAMIDVQKGVSGTTIG